MPYRRLVPLVLCFGLSVLLTARAQPPSSGKTEKGSNDLEVVELLVARDATYRRLWRTFACTTSRRGTSEAKWAEEELRQWHRISKQAFRLDLDDAAADLPGNVNVPEANALYMRAVGYKDKGWGTDYIDNQRPAEILLSRC
ncbi:MAG: hypothetical protein U0793_22635 [Gemmataceae bacterium]